MVTCSEAKAAGRVSPSGKFWSFLLSSLGLSPAKCQQCAVSSVDTCPEAAKEKQVAGGAGQGPQGPNQGCWALHPKPEEGQLGLPTPQLWGPHMPPTECWL